jgi:hypothetical protein
LQETQINGKDKHNLNVEGGKWYKKATGSQRQAGVAILISEKVDFKQKLAKVKKNSAF